MKPEMHWSRPLVEGSWTAIPSIIFEEQQALGLDSYDLNIIVHLACYRFSPDGPHHPSVGKIARAMGVTPRTVQKHIKVLIGRGFLAKRERKHPDKSNDTNIYSFAGLIKKATHFANERIKILSNGGAD